MGGTRWSDDHYRERASLRAKKGETVFAYDKAMGSAALSDRKVHENMDPCKVKGGIRESRDSDAHPDSRAVACFFDVTGSMRTVPQILQANLPKLMGLLIRKGYLEHPQIMIGAIGDATCDTTPLQVGQFESGIEIEEDLAKLFLEGGGGSHITESYELAIYFLAKHTALDSVEKRNKRGYVFFIGDEAPYPQVSREQVKAVIGDTLQADIPTEEAMQELEKLYDVYYVLPKMTTHYDNAEIHKRWVQLLGQNVLRLEEPAGICELIASTIGLAEGKIGIDELSGDLKEAGVSDDVAAAVSRALVPVASEKGAAISVPTSSGSGGLTKL